MAPSKALLDLMVFFPHSLAFSFLPNRTVVNGIESQLGHLPLRDWERIDPRTYLSLPLARIPRNWGSERDSGVIERKSGCSVSLFVFGQSVDPDVQGVGGDKSWMLAVSPI